ncbi:ubiquitin-conjugating enzyme E2 H [Aspergillus fumigatus]
MSSPKRRIETDVMKMLMSDYEVTLVNDNMYAAIPRHPPPTNHQPRLLTIILFGQARILRALQGPRRDTSPSIGFVNRIFHPNIDELSGSVCLDVINQTWSPMYDMINIFEVFLPQLLRYPNPSDPLNGEAAAMLMREPKSYEAKVKEYVAKYASKEAVDEAGEDTESEDELSSAGSYESGGEEPAGTMDDV